MITISLCMIVKNEEAVISRCLDSVSEIVDEINIIDTGSTDRTNEIVASYTDRIFDFTWVEDFSAARNFAFQQATADYILWLDADDVLLKEDQSLFSKMKTTLDLDVDAVSMHYNLSFDEHNNVTSSLRRYRLVKREKGFKWIGAVHEYLEVYGKLYDSDIAVSHMPLSHDTQRNLRIYETLVLSGKEFSPRDLFYYANELMDHQKIEKAIEYYLKFLKTNQGWIEDNISACNKLADCYNQLGLKEQESSWILNALTYDVPRPETCCRLAFLFLEKNEISKAIYWYKQALENVEKKSLSFQNHSCSTWLPHLQLVVCYDRIGQHQLAFNHNEMALEYRPNDPRMLHNKTILEKIINL
ncbi:glycosyltransferase [Sutcliffiella rhizosphaerae]|uniref:Glycosyltransferase 2-like domain-containing protein n=1 Tax=Sutcliffiella rhizosphaerae TaxID=2880967 RepID=A0ABM8YRU7_9BACI|nr:glycosyltransferase [Sutcliffiella rhizosphaerae]CAG9622714.1 hypothetical protein BACCIP111883_03505 [Sutcliffiella rhizosphaerae]